MSREGCVKVMAPPCVSYVQAQQPAASNADPPKATFPAYTQAPSSSSSCTSSSSSSSGSASSTAAIPNPPAVSAKPAAISSSSATSKLMHPDEDISLVSARRRLSRFIRFLFDSK